MLTKSEQRNFWIFALALAAATLLAYTPAWNGKPIWDDDAHLTRPELRSLHGLAEIWSKPGATQQYYPLVHSAFWLEQRLWHDAVLPYHLVNILLHAASALLVFVILRRLAVPGAWLAAAIFALHPVQVESVAWISELKNTLSGFFFLAATLFYLGFDEKRTRWSYLGALVLFVLGLLSKSVIATLPGVLLVIFWWRRGTIAWKRDVLPLLLFVALGGGAGLVTMWMERTQIGAVGGDFDFSFVARCLIAGRAVCFYFAKLFFPVNLTFVYPRWEIDPHSWWQYFFPFACVLVVIVGYLLRKSSRGLLASVLIFAGILFPALGFINVFPFIYSFVADHFQYLATVAPITCAAAGLSTLLLRFGVPARAGYVVCAVLPLVLGLLTWRQAHAYTDAETLYRTTLARNPSCWMAYNNLANVLMRSGRTDQAIEKYQRALELRPVYVEAHYNLANGLLRRGRVEEAIAHAETALTIKPDSAEAHNNLANALRQAGRFAEAIKHYEASLAVADAIGTKNNLAWLLATCADQSLRNIPKALSLAKEANEQSGGRNPIILHTLSAAYAQGGDFSRARSIAQQAASELARAEGNTELAEILQREIAQLDTLLRN